MTVEKLPTAGLPFRLITPAEHYAQPKPTDLMVWALCPYLRGLERCKGCPDWEASDDPKAEKMKRGCRGLAEEACRIVLAAKAKGR